MCIQGFSELHRKGPIENLQLIFFMTYWLKNWYYYNDSVGQVSDVAHGPVVYIYSGLILLKLVYKSLGRLMIEISNFRC